MKKHILLSTAFILSLVPYTSDAVIDAVPVTVQGYDDGQGGTMTDSPVAPVWTGTEDCADSTVGNSETCDLSSFLSGKYPPVCDVSPFSGALPPGRAIGTDCLITGTYTGAGGTYNYQVRGVNGAGVAVSVNISQTIAAGGGPTIGTGYNCPEDYCVASVINETVTANVSENNGSNIDSDYVLTASGNHHVGTFKNGDYWIAPISGSTATINSVTAADTVYCDIDPVRMSNGFLSSYSGYNAGDRVTFPYTSSGSTESLVCMVLRDEVATSDCGTTGIVGNCADSWWVVTILPAPPSSAVAYGKEAIRPPITGSDRTVQAWSDFDMSKIPSLAILTGTDTAGLNAIVNRWNHTVMALRLEDATGTPNEAYRAFGPHILVDDYGAGMFQDLMTDVFVLFSDDNTSGEKEKAVASIVTMGRDMFATMLQTALGYRTYSGAGQHVGKIQPAMLYAALQTDTTDKTAIAALASNINDSLNEGPQLMDQVNSGLWGDEWPSGTLGSLSSADIFGYWSDMVEANCFVGADGGVSCTQPGNRARKDPYGVIDGSQPYPLAAYAGITYGAARSWVAAMCAMSDLTTAWNFAGTMSWVDRMIASGVSFSSDTCAPPDTGNIHTDNGGSCNPWNARNSSPATAAQWVIDSGCTGIGTNWGPTPGAINTCISGSGRFSGLSTPSASFTVAQVETNWTALRALCP